MWTFQCPCTSSARSLARALLLMCSGTFVLARRDMHGHLCPRNSRWRLPGEDCFLPDLHSCPHCSQPRFTAKQLPTGRNQLQPKRVRPFLEHHIDLSVSRIDLSSSQGAQRTPGGFALMPYSMRITMGWLRHSSMPTLPTLASQTVLLVTGRTKKMSTPTVAHMSLSVWTICWVV